MGRGSIHGALANQATGELSVVHLFGTTVFAATPLNPPGVPDTQWQVRLVADFNRDGRADLLWWHQATGELYVWFLDTAGVAGASYVDPRAFTDFDWQLVPR